jgi:hypothetical protein
MFIPISYRKLSVYIEYMHTLGSTSKVKHEDLHMFLCCKGKLIKSQIDML